jgi:hypothetical protein
MIENIIRDLFGDKSTIMFHTGAKYLASSDATTLTSIPHEMTDTPLTLDQANKYLTNITDTSPREALSFIVRDSNGTLHMPDVAAAEGEAIIFKPLRPTARVTVAA